MMSMPVLNTQQKVSAFKKKKTIEDQLIEAIEQAKAEGAEASELVTADTSNLLAQAPAATATDAAASSTASVSSGAAASAGSAAAVSTGTMIGVGLAGATVVAVAANNNTSSNSTASNTSTPTPTTLNIQDGPISGASVYLDNDNSGTLTEGDVQVGTTNNQGQILVANSASIAGKALIAIGGTDTDTGLAFTGILKAPAGSTMINPLTTLVQQIIEANPNTSAVAAQAKVKTVLGLPDVDLTTFNPVTSNDATAALAVQKATVQVMQIVSSFTSSANASNVVETSEKVSQALANMVQQSSDALDLSTFSSLQQIKDNLPTIGVQTQLTETQLIGLASANAVIKNSESFNSVIQTQKTVQGKNGLATLNNFGVTTDVLTFTPFAGTAQDSSDASTAIVLDSQYMIVGDDEAGMLRVYPKAGGAAVAEWSFVGADKLNITDELDVEASVKVGDTIFFTGSHSNGSDGSESNDREFIFAVKVTGTGADIQFTFQGSISGLESALATWDNTNSHGKGADYFGMTAGSAAGVVPEQPIGFSIEGLTASPDGSALWLGFRAPQVSDKALMVAIENYEALLAGTDAAPIFGAPIELALGGRGIRSIERAEDGSGYLIIAGSAGSASAEVDHDFRFFTWTGNPTDAPVQLDNNLDALRDATHGSWETIAGVSSIAAGTWVQILQDNGDTDWSDRAGTTVSKKLPAADQKFQGQWVQLGAAVTDTTDPLYEVLKPADMAVNVAVDGNFEISYNEAIKAGTGNFTIKKASDDSIVETIAVNSANVSISYNKVTINPSSNLDSNTAYYIEADTGVVVDHANNQWAGLHKSDTTQYDFTTKPATTTLNAGDLLFVGANSDSTDAFAFVLLKDIVVGTQIGFTDRNYSAATGMPTSGESAFIWTANTDYKAGAIVTIQPDQSGSNNPIADKGHVQGKAGGLSATAETIYAFQGSIAGLEDGTAGAITADRWLTSINVGGAAAGDIPTEISSATSNLTFSTDNARYTGVFDVSSTNLEVTKTNIKNTANWTTSDSTPTTLSNGSLYPKYNLMISEVNSNATGGDFFELYNYGATSIDLTGWKWDDDSASLSAGIAIGSVTIAAGATLVVNQAASLDAFSGAWGSVSNAIASNGSGLGSGDAVTVFDSQGRVVTALSYKAGTSNITASDGTVISPYGRADGNAVVSGHAGSSAGGSDAKASLVWDGVSTSIPIYTYAVAGTLGAYSQATPANGTGSPGTVTLVQNGTSGNDQYAFTANNDLLDLTLGGSDTLVLPAIAQAKDEINGFSFAALADGGDKLDLSAFLGSSYTISDANNQLSGIQAFATNGTTAVDIAGKLAILEKGAQDMIDFSTIFGEGKTFKVPTNTDERAAVLVKDMGNDTKAELYYITNNGSSITATQVATLTNIGSLGSISLENIVQIYSQASTNFLV